MVALRLMLPMARPRILQISGRSTETDLARSVRGHFERSSYLSLRRIACAVTGDVVHLRGRTSSHHLKQIAQEIAGRVPGVRHVVNRIDVVPPSRGPSRIWGAAAPSVAEARPNATKHRVSFRISGRSTKEWEPCWS